jgi:ferric-dicitrate binding protein FerR (iron transport regulator)
MHREVAIRNLRRHRARRRAVPGWALALGLVVAGALLAWLHVVMLLGA